MTAIFVLLGAALSTGLYVATNFWLANWIVKRPWKKIILIYKIRQRNTALLLASPKMVFFSGIIFVSMSVGFFELNAATTFWRFSGTVLFIGIVPILAGILVIDKMAYLIEPQSSFVKWGLAAIGGLMVLVLKAMVGDELNSIFPFDPGAMPVALSAGIFLSVAGILAPAILLMSLPLELFIFFGFTGLIKRKNKKAKNFLIGLLSLGIFLGFYSSAFAFQKLALSSFRTLLIGRIAYEYDFNSKYLCHIQKDGKRSALAPNSKVLFLGSSQQLGISAQADKLPEKDLNKIGDAEIKKLLPFDFQPVVCNEPMPQ